MVTRKLLSQLRHLWDVLKTKGTRYIFKKLLYKISFNLDNIQNASSLTSSTLAHTAPLFLPLENVPYAEELNYQKWLNKNYPTPVTLKRMTETVNIFTCKPVISILMPVFNTPIDLLQESIKSVLNQVYPYWELCIADDASSDGQIRQVLENFLSKDSRIKVIFRIEKGYISRCSNAALAIATGEFIALLNHDDVLTPDALYEMVLLLNSHPQADMIYSDEDKISEDGKLKDPYFKPDWVPDSFLSRMYTSNLGAYRRSLVDKIGGFRVGYEGSQDYDLVLRLTEETENIFHIPKILYHSRVYLESTAKTLTTSKLSANNAAQRAILDALDRRNELGVVIPISGGHHIVRYFIKEPKLVSIIIPTRNLGKVLDKCLSSIFNKTQYSNYEVLVIDNGSNEAETLEIISQWKIKEPARFGCDILDIDFNYSKINNHAANIAKGEYLLFLNNDTEVLTDDWVDAMVEQCQRPSIGAVGALLLYPDNTVQHAGVVNIGGVAGHSHKHYSHEAHGYFNQLQTVNNYSSVTAACLMCRRTVFEEVGGFEEQLAIAFNDIDLCFKMLGKGYRNVYLPHVKLYHYESKSRGYEDSPEKQLRFQKEIQYMQTKWSQLIEYDPCYNPNLTKKLESHMIDI